MSGSTRQTIVRVVVTDATGRRVTAERFLTCRDCLPATVFARSAITTLSAESSEFTSSSPLFSSGFSCSTGQTGNRIASKNLNSLANGYSDIPTPKNNRSESRDVLPKSLILEQNTPNPFTNETVISIALPTASEINLTIHDVLGREVMTVSRGNLSAGVHTFTVIMASFPAGVYSYRLVANGKILTKTMMHLR